MYYYLLLVDWLKNLLEREEGQDLTEYALLLVLIVIACVVAVTALGTQIQAVMANAVAALGAA